MGEITCGKNYQSHPASGKKRRLDARVQSEHLFRPSASRLRVKMAVDRELNDITALLSNCLDAFTAGLFIWDDRSKLLALRSYHSLSKHVISAAQFSIEDGGLIGWVAKNNQAITIDHFDRDTRILPYYQEDENIKSFLAVPLAMGKGVLCVDSKRQYVFTSKEQKLLHGFATIVSNALGAERASRRHQQLHQLLTLWHRAEALPADADDPVPYFTRLLDHGCHYLKAEGGLVALPVKEGRFLQLVAGSGNTPSSLLQSAQAADQGLMGWIFHNRKSLIVPKFRSRARIPYLFSPDDGFGELGSLIGMPLAWSADDVGGVIAFFCRNESDWSKEEIAGITAAVRRAIMVLQNFTLKRELALVRNLDPVTEICNIHAFDRVLHKRLQRCQQSSASLGLAIFTVDGLEALSTKVALPDLVPLNQRISSILVERLQGRQLMGCLEPGSFAVLFEKETPGQMHAQLKTMANAVHREVLDRMNGPPTLRVRFGFAVFPQDAGTQSELWTGAFQALANRNS
jgi:GAF domain-containing protein